MKQLEPSDFLAGDGVRPGWDGDQTVESFAAASREWSRLRVEVWRLWSQRPVPWIPRGAEVHDGVRRVEDLDEFRRRQPKAARSIAEYLDLWEVVVEQTKAEDAERLAEIKARRAVALPIGDPDE